MMDYPWLRVLEHLGIAHARLIAKSSYDAARRSYSTQDHVYKIVLSEFETTSSDRRQSLAGEYAVLKQCAGISNVPKAIHYFEGDQFAAIKFHRINAKKLTESSLNNRDFLILLFRLSLLLFHLSLRGISHNDVLPSNILLDSRLRCYLIDFDQAEKTGVLSALYRNFFGLRGGPKPKFGVLTTIVRRWAEPNPQSTALAFLRQFPQRHYGGRRNRLPRISKKASDELKAIASAWRIAQRSNASSPGRLLAYYSLDFEKYHFPGERSWEERWDILKNIADVKGKRTLELGCNLALLSIFLLKEQGAAAAMAVDADEDILRSADAAAKAFGINLVLAKKNFDDDSDWETKLIEFKPDIVYALNVLNWVNDKARFMAFLGNFKEVVFEGHDRKEIEVGRFREVGFDDIKYVAVSERQRAILHCHKINKLNTDRPHEHGSPMISVITPCLNRASFIEEAIESVLAQNYPNVEHIIVDGGSTDGTLEVLKKYPHLRVVSEPDHGLYDAINKGLSLAKGGIIGHLNSDDFYEPDVFADVAGRFAEDTQIDMVYGGSVLFKDDETGKYRILHAYLSSVETELSAFNVIMWNPNINARFFRKRFYERIGVYNTAYLITADRDLLIRAVLAGVKTARLNRVVYHYRAHEGSLTLHMRPGVGRPVEHVDMTERYLRGGGLGSEVRSILQYWHSRQASVMAAQKFSQREFVAAARYIWRGWRFDARYPFRFLWFGAKGLLILTHAKPHGIVVVLFLLKKLVTDPRWVWRKTLVRLGVRSRDAN